MKRVLYTGLFSLPNEDAAAHRVHGIGKMLNELGYQVLYAGLYDGKKELPVETKESIYLPHPQPSNRKEWLRSQIDVGWILSIINSYENINAVFLYNFQSLPFGAVLRACRRKHICVYADCTEWHQAPKGSHFRLLKNLDTLKRIYIDDYRVDGMIVISSFLEDFYRKCNTVRIPPVFDYRETRKGRIQPQKNNRFVFTGTISAQKETVNEIVNAAKALHLKGYTFQLDIYGVSESDYLKVSGQTLDASFSSAIVFHGRVSHEECIRAVQNADYQIFVREANRVNTAGFPTKFGESFACGTPVITTPTSDIPMFLKDGYNGFVVQDEGLENVMLKAIEMSDEDYMLMRNAVGIDDRFDYRNYIPDVKRLLNVHGDI